jgi:MFS-type transporter involved in bile tolerance (Atg22 family)
MKLHEEILKEILSLSTSSFGLVAALAWNDAIQAIFKKYLSFGENSELISKIIYAMIVTILAVVVTINLAKVKARFEEKETK